MSGNEDSDVFCATDFVTTKTSFSWKITGLDYVSCKLSNLEGIKTKDFTLKVPGHRDSKRMMEIKPGTIGNGYNIILPIKMLLHSKNPGTINVHLTPYIWGFKDETTLL